MFKNVYLPLILTFWPLASASAGVCERTPEVVAELVRATHKPCAEITSADLIPITRIDFYTPYIDEPHSDHLKIGDFADMPNLEWIQIGNIPLKDLPVGIFEGLDNLRFLYIWGSKIQEIPSGLLRPLRKLESLSLSDGEVTTIAPDAFDGLEKLDWLDLSENPFTELPAGILQRLPKLKEIRLADTGMRLFPVGFVRGLTQLEQLDLNGTDFAEFPFSILGDLNLETFRFLVLYRARLPDQAKTNLKHLLGDRVLF